MTGGPNRQDGTGKCLGWSKAAPIHTAMEGLHRRTFHVECGKQRVFTYFCRMWSLAAKCDPQHQVNDPITLTGGGDQALEECFIQATLKLLRKVAIEELSNWQPPGLYSWPYLVPKKDQRGHLAKGLYILNIYLVNETFHMETTASILADMNQGKAVTSVDLKDTAMFLQQRAVRNFLCFIVARKVNYSSELHSFRLAQTLPVSLT